MIKVLIVVLLATSCCGGVYLRREVIEVEDSYCDYLLCEPVVVVKKKKVVKKHAKRKQCNWGCR